MRKPRWEKASQVNATGLKVFFLNTLCISDSGVPGVCMEKSEIPLVQGLVPEAMLVQFPGVTEDGNGRLHAATPPSRSRLKLGILPAAISASMMSGQAPSNPKSIILFDMLSDLFVLYFPPLYLSWIDQLTAVPLRCPNVGDLRRKRADIHYDGNPTPG